MNLVLAVIFQAFQKSHQKKIEDELKKLEGGGEDSISSENEQEQGEIVSDGPQDEEIEEENDEYGEEEIEEALEQVDDPEQTICNNDMSQSIAPGVVTGEGPKHLQGGFLRSRTQNVDKLRSKKKSTNRTLVKKNTTANVSQNQSTNLRKIKSVKYADAQSNMMQSQFAKTMGGGFIDFDDEKLMEEQRKYDNNEDFTAFLRVQATKRKIANMFIDELKEGVNHPIKHAISSKSHNFNVHQGQTNQTLQKVETEELKIADCDHTNSQVGPSFQGALQPVKSTISQLSKKKLNSPSRRRKSQMQVLQGNDTFANLQLLKPGEKPHEEADGSAGFGSQKMIMHTSGINCQKLLDQPNPENQIEASQSNGKSPKLLVPTKKHSKVLKQKTTAAPKKQRFKLIDSTDNQAIQAAFGESSQQKPWKDSSSKSPTSHKDERRNIFNKKASKTFTQHSSHKIITSSDSYDTDSEDRNMKGIDSLVKGQPGEMGEEQGMQGLLMKKFNLEIMKKMADIQEQTEVHKNEVKDRIDNNKNLKIMFRIIQSKVFSAFYLLVLISNIIVLSIDHSDTSNLFTTQLEAEAFNIVFVSLYALELLLKFGLFGVKSYFVTSQYVIFDCIVVIEGFIDIIVSSVLLGEDQLYSSTEITILRGLRILRIFKLIKYWRSFEILVETLWMTILGIQQFVQILLMLLVVYTLLGLELFSNKAKFNHNTNQVDFDHGTSPVFNFDNFLNSFTTVFVILTNDKQSEIYYDFFRAVNGISSTIFWMTFIILAQKILLNLFLSILLQNFNEGTLKNKMIDEEKEFIQDPLAHEAEKYNKWIIRVKERFIFVWVKTKSLFRRVFQRRSRRRLESDQDLSSSKVILEESLTNKEQENKAALEQEATSKHSFETQRQLEKQRKKVIIGKSLGFIPSTFKARKFVHRILKNNNYSRFIVICILASAIQLALDSPILDPDSQYKLTLFWIDLTTIIVFTIEGIAKIFAYGLIFNGPRSYLRDIWNILDCIILVFSYLCLTPLVSTFKVVKTFRILRSLRLIGRNEGLKVAVRALFFAIPNVLNITLIMLIFFHIFAVICVSYFKGKLHYCQDAISIPVIGYDSHSLKSKWDCNNLGGYWNIKYYHFDNIFDAHATLFVMATTAGWGETMFDTVASTDFDMEINLNQRTPGWILFFMIFMIVGNFFFINLFVGVVIETFKSESDRVGGTKLLTQKQQEWIENRLLVLRSGPIQKIRPPVQWFRKICFKIINHGVFDKFIQCSIIINTLVLMLKWTRQPAEVGSVTELMNYIFTFIFVAEAIMRIAATGVMPHFKDPWNLFDFIIAFGSLLGIVISTNTNVEIKGTSLLRAFRILRLLRLLKRGGKSLNLIFNTFIITMQSLANIGSLLLLIMYIYSIIGMIYFGEVMRSGIMNDYINFESFSSGFLTLFTVAMIDNWHQTVAAYTRERTPHFDCIMDPHFDDYQANGGKTNGCGNRDGSFAFFISYMYIVGLVFLKLFIACILEGYERTQVQESRLFNNEMRDRFREIWAEFDPDATSFIKLADLRNFLFALGGPLGFDESLKNNRFLQDKYIASLELPTYQNFSSYQFLDLLDALSFRLMVIDHMTKLEEEKLKLSEKQENNFILTGPGINESMNKSAITMKQEGAQAAVTADQSKSIIVENIDNDQKHLKGNIEKEVNKLIFQKQSENIVAFKDLWNKEQKNRRLHEKARDDSGLTSSHHMALEAGIRRIKQVLKMKREARAAEKEREIAAANALLNEQPPLAEDEENKSNSDIVVQIQAQKSVVNEKQQKESFFKMITRKFTK